MDAKPYKKKPEDEKYRFVKVSGGIIPKYDSFNEDIVSICQGYVMEIQKEDGSEFLVSPIDGMIDIEYSVIPIENQIKLPAAYSTERIWVRSRKGGIEMKVPKDLFKDGTSQYMYIPGGADQVELVGDKYFNKVYRLIRKE